jgi:hypothetical protein
LTEAATALGITPDALRQRIRRGRYRTEKEAGRVYVYLDTDRTKTERPTEQEPDALTSELRARVESLERQLEQEREANRENRRLLAAALERIPAIEAPDTEETTPEARTEAATAPEDVPAPWYRRWFGGS